MRTLGILMVVGFVLAGCGSSSPEATASTTNPPAASGQVQKGTAKAMGGFSATAAGQNPEARLGSK
jgi:hypothetical protein